MLSLRGWSFYFSGLSGTQCTAMLAPIDANDPYGAENIAFGVRIATVAVSECSYECGYVQEK